jgi:hypothetical protein
MACCSSAIASSSEPVSNLHCATSVWQIDKNKSSETGHSTQKPVECMRRPIENNSSPGQAIYEPFCGSGTTIIAAAMTGRGCHAIELSPAYVDVGVKRWQDFTGEAAVLDGDGRTFDQIAAERQPPLLKLPSIDESAADRIPADAVFGGDASQG